MDLTIEKRGVFVNLEYLDPKRVMLTFEIPLAEIIAEFHDLLKSVTRGYASMDYEVTGYRVSDLVKMDILLNQEPVDALSIIVPRDQAHFRGKKLVGKLKEAIPFPTNKMARRDAAIVKIDHTRWLRTPPHLFLMFTKTQTWCSLLHQKS